ncbi:MAG: FAD-dependent oxidoreductase [Fusobacteriaceae bacterium]|nr:FAD-dependent oxidoreductase [Fusobacteriaceae bacterium]
MKKRSMAFWAFILTTAGLASQGAAYRAGTYEAEAKGHNGPLKVSVTVSDDKILDLAVVETVETPGIGSAAFEIIRDFVLANQSLAVDSVAGATISRAVYLSAVTNALKEAGADVTALQNRKIERPTPGNVDYSCDVVIVGSGLAGTSAAIEAASGGAKVIVLEYKDVFGGISGRARGMINAAGTALQKANGIEDTPEKMYEDWMEGAKLADDKVIDPEMTRFLADHSNENLEWVIAMGVPFRENVEAPHSYPPFNAKRVHQVKAFAEGVQSEASTMLVMMREKAISLGVSFHSGTRAEEILMTDGKAAGIKAKGKYGNEILVKAPVVILCAGSISGNKELMAKYFEKVAPYFENRDIGTGDGFVMAEKAGAQMDLKLAMMGGTKGLEPGVLTIGNNGELRILPDGARYIDENAYASQKTDAMFKAGYGYDYAILPPALYKENEAVLKKLAATDKVLIGNTVAELAAKLGVKPEVLGKTLSRYNSLCNAKKDDDFGKPEQFLIRLEPPFAAVKLGLSSNGTFVGPRINVNAQVLDKAGNAIPGLYAAGANAPAQTISLYMGSGSALINDITFGRQAGRDGVRYIREGK